MMGDETYSGPGGYQGPPSNQGSVQGGNPDINRQGAFSNEVK